uniref:Reactive intermediate/imine deaminase n=1 Tax=Candidatus Kentrum sp. DK TaxID=2126562 RepID=A0A450S8A2_9GAMM|nr:MAG: reactive intermediate/imine deaminase [Candidatus Kentron sp. DK]VFJ53102.1 MAG: reactive intermediate/imine deaminase [Candidatus Kentron sp. DK]
MSAAPTRTIGVVAVSFFVLSLLFPLSGSVAETQRGGTAASPGQNQENRIMTKKAIETAAAPAPVGTYSQAIEANGTVYISGQVGFIPGTMELAADDARAQIHQVFKNLRAIAEAAGGDLDKVVKLTVYLTDIGDFPQVNEVMATYFNEPYPARAAVGVASLPKGARVEMDAVLVR